MYYYADDQDHRSRMEFYKRFDGNKIYTWKYFDYTRIQLMNERTLRYGHLYWASLLTLLEITLIHGDKVSIQWLSWTHVPIVSRGHDYNYEMRLQVTRLFKMK